MTPTPAGRADRRRHPHGPSLPGTHGAASHLVDAAVHGVALAPPLPAYAYREGAP
ncbi:hypothetical protein ACWCQS_20745 [Streptomyces sp. NPDC002076]